MGRPVIGRSLSVTTDDVYGRKHRWKDSTTLVTVIGDHRSDTKCTSVCHRILTDTDRVTHRSRRWSPEVDGHQLSRHCSPDVTLRSLSTSVTDVQRTRYETIGDTSDGFGPYGPLFPCQDLFGISPK